MNWEVFKAPIMAIVKVAGLMPGIPTYNNRFLFYIILIVPFFPIYKYWESLNQNGDSFGILLFGYFLFYLICSIFFTHGAKKIGKRWYIKEYEELKPDQIIFPFILVVVVNATLHFGVLYFLTKILS